MRKLLVFTVIVGMLWALTACGKKDDDNSIEVNPPSPTAVPDFFYECGGTITLGEYKGLTFSNDTEVSEKEIEDAVKELLSVYPNYVKDETRDNTEVKDGDVLNIDYLGKVDGVAFSGGEAKGANLEIGSNSFIEGFESSLIGKKVGETCDINVTFPKVYQNNPDLAGKPAVFTVTINYVCTKVDELTDDYVKTYSDDKYKTVEEFKKYMKETLEAEKKDNLENAKMLQLINAAIENATITVDSKDVEHYAADTIEQFKTYASMYGEEYLLMMYGFETYEDFEKNARERAEETVKQFMVLQAIVKAEGIVLDEESYKQAANEYMKEVQIDDLEAFEGTYGKDYIQYCILTDKAWKVLIDNAKEVPFEPEDAEKGEENSPSDEEKESEGTEDTEKN